MSTDETYEEVMNTDVSKKMMELILKWRDAAAGYNHHGEHCAAHGFEECAHDLETILPDIPHNPSLKADKLPECPECKKYLNQNMYCRACGRTKPLAP